MKIFQGMKDDAAIPGKIDVDDEEEEDEKPCITNTSSLKSQDTQKH